MKLFALHQIHRMPKDSPAGTLPTVINAGDVFEGTAKEMDIFKRLAKDGGPGATVAAREATAGEIADWEAKQDIKDGLDTSDIEEVDIGDKGARTAFEQKVADDKAKKEAADRAASERAVAGSDAGKAKTRSPRGADEI